MALSSPSRLGVFPFRNAIGNEERVRNSRRKLEVSKSLHKKRGVVAFQEREFENKMRGRDSSVVIHSVPSIAGYAAVELGNEPINTGEDLKSIISTWPSISRREQPLTVPVALPQAQRSQQDRSDPISELRT